LVVQHFNLKSTNNQRRFNVRGLLGRMNAFKNRQDEAMQEHMFSLEMLLTDQAISPAAISINRQS
jgi:hypothetical protein